MPEITNVNLPTSAAQTAAAGKVPVAGPLEQERQTQKLEELSKKFEGLLLHQMFKQAQQTTDQFSESGGGDEEESQDAGTEQYQSLFWTQMSDVVSEQGGIGLWKTMYGQLRQQVDNAAARSAELDSMQ